MDYRHVTSATVLIVVYTKKGESIRIISARIATPTSVGITKKVTEFPHQQGASTVQEVATAEVVRKQFGIELP